MKLPPNSISPDFNGRSIVNLMASLGKPLGMNSNWEQSSLLPSESLGKRQVFLVIDGLGFNHLSRISENGFLSSHCKGKLTSVLPSATASAIPVFLTGESPGRHGFTGWFTWFRELSMTAAILPYASRAGFMSLEKTAKTPAQLSGVRPFAKRIDVPVWHVAPERIAFSCFSKDFSGAATVLPFRDARQMGKQILQAVSQFDPAGYVYAYWPDYDHMAHGYGVNSDEADQHLLTLEIMIEDLATKLRGSDVDLIICADHGFTDCPPEKQYIFSKHFPELADMTRMSLTGEPRLAFAYLKDGMVSDFLQAAEESLDNIATMVSSEQLCDSGHLGRNNLHPELRSRVGDVCLMMHDHTVMFDPLPGETAPEIIGHHGGLSAEEMFVPLIHCRC